MAASQTIYNGTTFLYSSQAADGRWTGNITDDFYTTTEVLNTLLYVGKTGSEYVRGSNWIASQSEEDIDFLSQRVFFLNSSSDLGTLLSNRNQSGGWGSYHGFIVSSVIDTVCALQALKAANYADQTVINGGTTFILNSQNADGGWGICSSSDLGCSDSSSNVFVTAKVLSYLQQLPQTTTLATAVNKATSFLLSKQQADGSWGTVYETSLAYIALVGVITDNTVLGNAINYLTSTQLPNGSWNNDPYSTALALRALYLSANKPTPPPSPTTGTVTGRVVDASTNQPLAGVSVVSGQLSATTTNTGAFTLSNVQPGSQTISISLAGYATSKATVNITAGSIINLGTIPLSTNPTTGIIKGTITDAANGLPLQGATVTVTGSFAGTTATAADGTFTITNITPGTVTITASLTGYYAVSGTGTITAGGALLFNPKLSTTPPTATTGNLTGKVYDSATNKPIQGATITLSNGLSTTTDSIGVFLIQNLAPGAYNATVSAVGCIGQSSQVMIMAGVTVDVGTIYLTVSLQSTTVSGKVTDLSTGKPIPNADISIVSAGFSAKTDSNGIYTITGINLMNFTLKASATGYDSKTFSVTTTAYGSYTIDFSLNKSVSSDLKITAISTDKKTYSLNENVTINATIQNTGTANISGIVTAEIQDNTGNVIAQTSPTNPNISLAPSATIQTTMTWNTGQFSPGAYSIIVKVTAPQTGYPTAPAALLAELSTAITITEGKAMVGSISLNPPVTQANMQTPIMVKTAIRNAGNVPITTTMTLTASLNGSTVYTTSTAVTSLQVNGVMEIDLGSFTPSQGGNYTITLTPADQTIAANISNSLYAGPYATGVFTVTPNKAVTGDAKVTGKISLKGIATATGAVQDPLVPLIKAAIQKGVNWEQASVWRWQISYNCNGCHIQAQALVGLDRSRDKVVVDEYITNTLFNAFKGWQLSNGAIGGHPQWYYYANTMTQLGLWALTTWHDQNEAKPYIIKAADYLLTRQNADSSWSADHVSGWWGENVSATALSMIGIRQAYTLSNDPKYIPCITQAARYMAASGRVASYNNMARAHQIIGLQSVLDILQDATLKGQVRTTIDSAIQALKSSQRQDGGWGMYTIYGSDSMVTAQVVYAMLAAGIPGDDPILRKAVQYLLNTQAPDGSWYSQNGILTTNLAATTWVIISLPVALETIAGVSADLTATFPSNIAINSLSINPDNTTVSGSDTIYTWNFKGLTDASKELDLGLTLKGLQLGEQRHVAKGANISFNDSYTGKRISIPLDIPYVTGIGTVAIKAATDKQQYNANEDVKITTTLTNNTMALQSPTVQVFVEDQNGNQAAKVTSFAAANLEPMVLPGWTYRIPTSITATRDLKNNIAGANLDFNSIMSTLGISGKTIDQNSIRVIETDALKNLIGEKQAKAVFQGNTARVSWFMDGLTPGGTTRYFRIYFDTADNGSKPFPANTKVPTTGSLIGYTDDAGNVYVMENNQDGTFGAPRLVDNLGYGSRGIVLDDFNGDGYIDIIAGSGSSGQLFFYKNKADGTNTFYPKALIGTIYSDGWIMGMAAGDFTGNGKKSFVVSGNNTALYLFKGNGNGTFVQTTIPAPYGSSYLRAKAAADFNNDGKMDLVTASYWNGAVYLYKGNGDGTFASPVLIGASGNDPYGLVAGDFDEDGKIDLIENVGAGGDAYLYAGNGNGTFGSPTPITTLNTGYYAAFASGDFNNDGHLDLLAVTYTSNTIIFYSGRGNGTFAGVTIATTANAALGISSSPAYPDVWPVTNAPEKVPPQFFTFTWNTGNTPAGNYRVHAILSEGQTVVSEAYAQFTILPDKKVTSKVTTDKISYTSNQPVTITSTITSQSTNYILTNLNAVVTIANPNGAVIYTDTKPVPILTPGQLTELKTYWNTANNPKGTYTVTLQVLDGTTTLSASKAVFQISGSAETGSGLSGTLNALPNPVYQGKAETLSYTVTNKGNEDMMGLSIKIIIVDPDTQSVMQTFNGTTDIAMNITASGNFTASTSNLKPKKYLAILQASSTQMTKPRTLASAVFEVKPGIEATKTIPDLKNLLVWVNKEECEKPEVKNEKSKENEKEENCIRVDLLEKMLKEAVTSYLIVYDKKDFQRELRNPYYTDILILGEHSPVEDHYKDELREKVYSGTGAVSSLWMTHGEEEEGTGENSSSVFGIKHIGEISGKAHTVTTVPGPITTDSTINAKGEAERVKLIGTPVVAGWMMDNTEKEEKNEKEGPKQYPAIVLNNYGSGKAVYYAFDLGATLDDASYAQLETLIKNSLSHVHKPIDVNAFRPGQLIPVEITLKSLGAAFDLKITETYPSGLHIYDPSTGKWIADNPWIINLHLGPNETKTVLYYALLPDKTGTYTTQTEVGYIDNGSYTFYQTMIQDIVVSEDTASTVLDVLSGLNSLQVSKKDASRVKEAGKHMEKVRNRKADDYEAIEKNIHDTLEAVSDLLQISSADTTNIRLLMDALLRIWEERWYYR